MRHVSIHHSTDTLSHIPVHTRLVEYTPPRNRLWALAFKIVTYDQYFHFRLLTGGQHHHREQSPQAKQLSHILLCSWQRLMEVTHTVRETTITDDSDAWCVWLRSPEPVRWHELCTMANCDCHTSWAEATVWYHQRIPWHARRARSKCDRYRIGRFDRLDESPWCCQIDCPAWHGTEDTSEI